MPRRDAEWAETLADFRAEAEELIGRIDADLLAMDRSPEDEEILKRIFRSLHTLKGNAAFMGLEDLRALAHRMEDLLNLLRAGERPVTRQSVDLLLEALDGLRRLLAAADPGDPGDADVSALIERLEGEIEPDRALRPAASAAPEGGDEGVGRRALGEALIAQLDGIVSNLADLPDTDASEFLLDRLRAARRLLFVLGDLEAALVARRAELVAAGMREGAAAPSGGQIHAFQEIAGGLAARVRAGGGDLSGARGAIDRILGAGTEAEGDGADLPGPGEAAGPGAEPRIRVEVARLDALVDLVGELVLARNQLLAARADAPLPERLVRSIDDLDGITTELQAAVMRTRMVRMHRLLGRVPRVVRDIAARSGKRIRFRARGAETELDRRVIEKMADPLLHLVRNACDHGIEPPAERLRRGKPETGAVWFEASRDESFIRIAIRDDGRGLDPERIAEEAVARGLARAEDVGGMPARELYRFIFEPGFSTAETVTEFSGRGVGMDVVARNLAEINGYIDVESRVGRGTRFLIRIPRTLAIVKVLVLRAGAERFAVPINAVVEALRLSPEGIRRTRGGRVLRIRERLHPVVSLAEVFPGFEGLRGREASCARPWVEVLLLGRGEDRIGLIVDEILGQEEIVIKSLGAHLGRVPGISGGTVLGDGQVVLVLDSAHLVQAEGAACAGEVCAR